MDYYVSTTPKKRQGEDGESSSGIGINRENWEGDSSYDGGVGIHRDDWGKDEPDYDSGIGIHRDDW